MRPLVFAAVAALSFSCAGLSAQEVETTLEQQLAQLDYRQGAQTLEQAGAVLALEADFRYLGATDARRVLEEFWGNPPDPSVLGLVLPVGLSLADTNSWVAVVTYSDEGYVSDQEANAIDYSAMLQEMKDGAADENAMRRQAGYPTVELIGWASPPRYDATAKKLHWAKELAFEGSDGHTVNYDVRVLGRRGYLSLNAIGHLEQLEAMQSGMQRLIPQVDFIDGERYADFDGSTDKVAAYGLAALVGGAFAAKTGLLGKLLALLIAAKKIVIPLAIGAIALAVKLFRRKGETRSV
jgi:uncharacterized membrane-anchored protein